MLKDESDRNVTYFAVRWRPSNLLTYYQRHMQADRYYKRQRTAHQFKIVNLYNRK